MRTKQIQSNLFNTDTTKGQNQVSALQRYPYYRGRERMIFGISGTKLTVRISVRKERLDCIFLKQPTQEFVKVLATKAGHL